MLDNNQSNTFSINLNAQNVNGMTHFHYRADFIKKRDFLGQFSNTVALHEWLIRFSIKVHALGCDEEECS